MLRPPKDALLILLGLALAGAIFLGDVVVALGIAAGVPYVAVVIVSLFTRSTYVPILTAALATALIILGYFVSPVAGVGNGVALANRGLALFAIWTVAILGALLKRVEESRARAQSASRSKSRFLAAMGHDLRTPLTAIVGYVELLRSEVLGPLTERQADALRRINTTTSHLVTIIDEILTFAHSEHGAETVQFSAVNLADLAEEVVEIFSRKAADRNLALRVSAQDPVVVLTDGGKVRHILVNLIDNALEYTDEGAVQVKVEEAGDVVRVRVQDTGIGIPPDRLDTIFEPFTQVGDPDRTGEGLGLGLAISRSMARALSGDLTAASTVGDGSTFILHLPRKPPSATPVGSGQSPASTVGTG